MCRHRRQVSCGRVVVSVLVEIHQNSDSNTPTPSLTSKPTHRHGPNPSPRFTKRSNTTMPTRKLTPRSTHRQGAETAVNIIDETDQNRLAHPRDQKNTHKKKEPRPRRCWFNPNPNSNPSNFNPIHFSKGREGGGWRTRAWIIDGMDKKRKEKGTYNYIEATQSILNLYQVSKSNVQVVVTDTLQSKKK